MALRFDRGTLREPVRLANGHLRVDARISRPGVFEYRRADGSIWRELRPEDEVFAPESLASFGLVPVTNDHPPEAVTASNATQYTVGATGENVRRDGDFVVASLVIYDAETIAQIENGKREVSLGYHVGQVDATPGEHNGQRYDAVQRQIRGNHTAIVSRGRAGHQVALRMDAAVMIDTTENAEDFNMDPKQIVELVNSAATANARADAAETRCKELETKLVAATKAADDARARADAAAENVAKLEKERTDAASADRADMRARLVLEDTVRGVMGGKYTLREDATDTELRTEALGKLKVTLPEGASDAYIEARFDAALEARAESASSNAKVVATAVANTRADADPELSPIEAARARQAERNAKRANTTTAATN